MMTFSNGLEDILSVRTEVSLFLSQKGSFTLAMVEDSQVPAYSDSLQLSVFVLLPFCGKVSTDLGNLV